MLVVPLLLAALAYALWRVLAGYPTPSERYGTLARHEVAFVLAAADALFPRGGPVPPSGADAGVPAYVDRYLAAVPPLLRFLMRCLFLLFEHATFFVAASGSGGRRRFSSLSPEQRVAVLDRWRRSSSFAMRIVFTSLRAIFTMGYFADPAVLRALRLAPYAIETPIVEADLLYPPIGRSVDEIRFGPQDLGPPSDGRPLDLDGPLHPAYAEGGRS